MEAPQNMTPFSQNASLFAFLDMLHKVRDGCTSMPLHYTTQDRQNRFQELNAMIRRTVIEEMNPLFPDTLQKMVDSARMEITQPSGQVWMPFVPVSRLTDSASLIYDADSPPLHYRQLYYAETKSSRRQLVIGSGYNAGIVQFAPFLLVQCVNGTVVVPSATRTRDEFIRRGLVNADLLNFVFINVLALCSLQFKHSESRKSPFGLELFRDEVTRSRSNSHQSKQFTEIMQGLADLFQLDTFRSTVAQTHPSPARLREEWDKNSVALVSALVHAREYVRQVGPQQQGQEGFQHAHESVLTFMEAIFHRDQSDEGTTRWLRLRDDLAHALFSYLSEETLVRMANARAYQWKPVAVEKPSQEKEIRHYIAPPPTVVLTGITGKMERTTTIPTTQPRPVPLPVPPPWAAVEAATTYFLPLSNSV